MYTVILRPLIVLFLLLIAGVSFAQPGGYPEKTAFRNIEKHRWQKAEMRLRKTLGKNPVNPGARYVLSLFFFRPENPAFNLDSAYYYALTALDDYALSPEKERERLGRVSVDSLRLIGLRAKIDSTAFEIARKTNTEAAYQEFLSHFPSSIQRDLAVELRDEVAYQDAVKENTHQAFRTYLNRYPEARRAPEARSRYEHLLYQAETKDQRLSSYEKFLKDYPGTPYRDELHRHIFEISTADGSVEAFLDFLSRYPRSGLVKRAKQFIFHIVADEDDPEWPTGILNDSLQHLLDVNRNYLVPILNTDHYGFMDEAGKEILPPVFKSIQPEYLCGHITDELLAVEGRLINRAGSLVYPGKVENLVDLGLGFLKVEAEGQVKIIHKSGFLVHDSVDDARIISRKYIAVRKNSLWRLYTLTGRLLDENEWEGIAALHDVIVFTNGQKEFIAPKNQLSKCADGIPMVLSEPFDELKPWPNGLIWGRSGDFQGVLNQSLEGVIGFDRHVLTRNFFGATAAVPNGIALYNWAGKRSSTFDQTIIFPSRIAVKKQKSWFFYDPAAHEVLSRVYDSIRAEGAFLIGLLRDSTVVYFDNNRIAAFPRPIAVTFIPGMDSTSFLVVQENSREKMVFDRRGKKLFTAAFDAIEYAGQNVFVVTKKDKKGLLNVDGDKLLSPDYDAIGSAKDQVLSILRNKKFGAYSIRHNKTIKPQYDRNLMPYNEDYVVTFKEGYYGFSGWDSRPLSAFEFDEIRYWDDSLALVKKGSIWSFYDIPARKITDSNIRKIIMVKDTDTEKIAIIQKDSNYGVVSSRHDVVIPVTFSNVVNLGSRDEPLYFTEKHIKEAALFIVIYYDANGSMLRKEIYDDATDYDKIYCSDH